MRIAISGPDGTGSRELAAALVLALQAQAKPETVQVQASDLALLERMTTYLRLPLGTPRAQVVGQLRTRHPEEYLHMLESQVEDQTAAVQRACDFLVSPWAPFDAAALALQFRGSTPYPRVSRFVSRCAGITDRTFDLILYLDPAVYADPGSDPALQAQLDLTTRGLYSSAGIEFLALTSVTVQDRVLEALPRSKNGPYRRTVNPCP